MATTVNMFLSIEFVKVYCVGFGVGVVWMRDEGKVWPLLEVSSMAL